MILAGLGLALSSDPLADPPLGASDLEGQLLLGARARVPGQPVPLGEWAPEVLLPFQTRIHAAAFRLFGVRLTSARRVSVAAALLAILLLYLLVLRSSEPRVAFLAALFLAVNPVFFAMARTALPPALSLVFLLGVIWLWVAGARRRLFSFLAGLALIGAGLAENGPVNAHFLLAGLLMAVFLRLHAWKMAWFPQTRSRLRFFLSGCATGLAVLFLFMLGHWDQYGLMWHHFLRVSPRSLTMGLLQSPVSMAHLVQRMPVVALVAMGYFLFFAKSAVRPIARHRRLDEVRLWFLSWLLTGVPFFVFGSRTSISSLVLLVPPICVLAAEGLVRLLDSHHIQRPQIDVMIVMLLIASLTWFFSASLVHHVSLRMNLPTFWQQHWIRASLASAVLLWAALTYLLGWLYLKSKKFTLPLAPIPIRILTSLLLVTALALGANRSVQWWRHRTHRTETLSAAMGVLPPNALVVGSWAPLLTLGHPAGAAIIWPHVNSNPLPWHSHVTHLLLQQGRESDAALPPLWLFAKENGGPGVALLGEVGRIRGKHLFLYRVLLPDR